MKKITILALAAVAGGTIVAACGGSTKNSSNSEDEDGGNSSSGGTSSGGTSSGGSGDDADMMTTEIGDTGISVTTDIACTSAEQCTSPAKCYGSYGYSGTVTFTTACSSTAPTGGLGGSLQICATASECTTTGDQCSPLSSAFGGGVGGGALPASVSDLSACLPEAGAATMNDAGCYVYAGMTYCAPDGGYPHPDGGYTPPEGGSTPPSDATTTTVTDGSTGGG